MPKLGKLDPEKLVHSQGKKGKDFYWLEDGLALAVTPAGGKSWYRKYTKDGKAVWQKLGDYPALTRKMAEKRNAEVSLKLLNGVDPLAEKRGNESASRVTLGEYSFKQAARLYLDLKKPDVTQRYYYKLSSWINRLNTSIADVLIRDLDMVILRDAFNSIGMKPRAARANFWTVKEIARRALLEKKASKDNLYYIKIDDIFGKPPPTQHHASLARNGDLEGFRTFLRVLEGEVAKGLNVASVVKALIYLPLRKVEMMSLKWENVDMETGTISIAENANKLRYLVKQPMSRQLKALFELQRMRYPKCEYVFPGRDDKKNTRISDPSTVQFIVKIGYNQIQSIHGLRSCFKTWGKSILFLQSEVTELTLNHEVKNKVGKAYDFTDFWKERQEGLQKWADWIDGLIVP